MEAATKKLMALHLRALGTGKLAPIHLQYGICSELAEVFDYPHAFKLIHMYADSWDERSFKPEFPVPHAILGAEAAYIDHTNLWDANTAYGLSRRRLCIHLADCLEEEIELILQSEQDVLISKVVNSSPSDIAVNIIASLGVGAVVVIGITLIEHIVSLYR